MNYNRQLMMAILYDKVAIAKVVNARPSRLETRPADTQSSMPAPQTKYVLNPNGYVSV